MKIKLHYLVSAIIIPSLLAFSQLHAQTGNPFYQHAHYAGQEQQQAAFSDTGKDINELMTSAVEDPSQRTEFSSCYKTCDGQVIYKYSTQLLNYPDANNQLIPVKIDLKTCANGWEASQQPYPCYFYLDRSTGISVGNGDIVKFNEDCKVNGNTYQQQLNSVSNTRVNITLTKDISKEISFLINGIKTDYIINNPIGDNIKISEGVEIPKGAVLKPDSKNGNRVEGMWRGDYILVGADGQIITRFKAPLCYDSKKSGCVGYYYDSYQNGKHILYTVVPSWWLKSATYPLTVDPTVMGPVSHWPSNLNIPSDLYPKFYTDSILVTIPGGITITRLYASFCFETNLLNGIYYTYGRIFFRTKCAQTPVLQCDSDPHSLPGICYLDTLGNNNDFGPQGFVPLTCCMNPSCSPQTFYFTVGLSRDCSCPPNAPDSTQWLWSPAAPNPYPFYAYIVGKTDEATWLVTPGKVCSNQCTLNLTANASYGVPPYTITHPWGISKTVFGTSTTCNASKGSISLPITIPGCPTYCGSPKTLSVPPPVIYDACGDTVAGLTAKNITINPVPKITTTPDSITICNGSPVTFNISSCSPGTLINWTGSDMSSGSDSTISYVPKDSTNTSMVINYTIYSSNSGCQGDTDFVKVKVNPTPTVTVSKDTSIIEGNSVTLSLVTDGSTYNWYPALGLSCTNCPNPIATPSVTTTYYVTVTDPDGCSRTDSVTIDVIPQAISIPNVFTPNGDNKNDVFYVKNLEYYPNTHLVIYDRWGKKVYESSNYPNNWNGGDQSDGVYYYVLTLPNSKKFDGYVQILR